MAKIKHLVAIASLLGSSYAMGAGYEKASIWGAEQASLLNLNRSNVSGADAVLFNPAGLVNGPDREYSFNLSPTQGSFKGITVIGSTIENTSDKSFSPIFAIASKYKMDEKWSLGYGIYALGGTKVDHGSQDFSGEVPAAWGLTTLQPELGAELSLIEFSIAGAYKINDNFSAGLGWRATFVQGGFTGYNTDGATFLAATEFKDLTDQDFGAFRAGLQYASDDKSWGVGFMYRTEVKFKGEGDVEIRTQALTGGAISTTTADASIENAFPAAYALTGHFDISPEVTIYAGYTNQNYSTNEEYAIEIGGTASTPIPQDWSDSETIGLGAEYRGFAHPIRASYAHVTPATDPDNASASATPPGNGYSFAIGSTYPLEKGQFDYAFEMGGGSGDGSAYYSPTTEGTFSSEYITLHASYKIPW